MYYRKRYKGTVSNFTDKRNVAPIGTSGSGTLSIFANQTDVVSNALVDIFHDIGFKDARYDSTTAMIYFDSKDKNGFMINYASNMQLGLRIRSGTSWSSFTCSSGAGYQPFNTSYLTYDFYITIIGEPKGYFVVCFGTYSTPASITSSLIHFYFGKNLITDEKVFGVALSTGWSNISSAYFTTKEVFSSTVTNISFSFSILGLTGNLILVNKLTNVGYIMLDNVYMYNTSIGLSYGETYFIEYEGEKYWIPNSYNIVKCITELEV